MRKLREFLRLHFENKLSARAIGRSVKVSPSTAQVYLSRIRVAGLTWPLPPELDNDEALTRVMFTQGSVIKDKRPEPNWVQLHLELKMETITKNRGISAALLRSFSACRSSGDDPRSADPLPAVSTDRLYPRTQKHMWP